MKISRISIQDEFFPLKNPFITALRRVDTLHALHVIVETDTGLKAVGSMSPIKAITGETAESLRAGIKHLSTILIGQSLENLNEILYEIESLQTPGPLAAIDMALYDLYSQSSGLPLYKLLGGTNKSIISDLTISLRDPKLMVQDALDAVSRGFKTLKIKLGDTLENDIIRFRALSQAVDCSLRIDANQGWSLNDTLKFMDICDHEELKVDLLEQPVPGSDYKGMSMIRKRISCPLAADESVFTPQDALKVIENESADIINIKLLKCGGIYQARKIAGIASSAGIECMIGCMMESPIGIAAALHLASASPEIRYFDLDVPYLLKDPVSGFGLKCTGNILTVSDRPGFLYE
jgi:L-alanine-DL-glutamate epimerase-like enolase superfamily enzyme